jgi:lysozyme family protein
MRSNFDEALRQVLVHEGAWSNHPRDPGGATMRGVTQRVYDGWRTSAGQPKQSVRRISQVEIEAIYRQLYADKIAFDALPLGVDLAVLDGAVNSGPAQAAKWLQRALGSVLVDGVIGPATLNAVRDHQDYAKLISDMCNRRLRFLRHLKTWDAFGKGWGRRVREIEAAARTMRYSKAVVPLEQGGTARAPLSDARNRPTKRYADATTGAGAASGAIAGALKGAQDGMQPLAGSGGWIDTTVAVLALASAALIAGGIAWRWWQRRRALNHADALDLPSQVAA